MTPTEITEAARLIRPHLTRELSMCIAVYPPTHPNATMTHNVERAIVAFDRLVQAVSSASPQPATERGEHIGLAVADEVKALKEQS